MLKEIIGNKEALEQLAGSFNTNKAAHSWLISGPEGIGKNTMIEALSQHLFAGCSNSKERIAKRSFPDTLFIEKHDEEILIDDIRRIRTFLSLTPAESDKKIVVIDKAERMNKNAANALLKVLEEPTPNTYIFLITNTPYALLPTIKSRCRHLKMNNLNREEALMILKGECSEQLLTLTNNSPGKAIFFQENDALVHYQNIIDCLKKNQINNILKISDLIAKDKGLWNVVSYLLIYLVHNIIKYSIDPEAITEIVSDELVVISNLSKSYNVYKLVELAENINNIILETKTNNADKKQAFIIIIENLRVK
jgi:DNA polymerase III subunit delta'